jgi:hypothetical protein
MSSQFRWPWKEVLGIGTFLLVALGIGAAATYATLTYVRSPIRPQLGVIISYGLSTGAYSGCGGVAVVRIGNGKVVRAASFQTQDGSFRRGAQVTVTRSRSTCPPALYIVLHGGPPNSSAKRTRVPRAA